MPVITVSSVNTTTDELTATAHGLITGDRFRLRNVGGALPAATPALAAVTDYFAIRTGANTLKISDTNAHALAGTGIFDLTGAGSGTNTVEYGLPYCNPTALAAAGTQIKSANDRDAWSALVALYDLLTAQAQSIWTGVQLAGALTVGGDVNVAGHLHTVDPITHSIALAVPASGASIQDLSRPVLVLSTSIANNILPLVLPAGIKITGWEVRLQKTSSSGTITASLNETVGSTGAASTIGAAQTNSANNPGFITLGQSGLSFTTSASRTYYLYLSGGGITGDAAFGYQVTPG